VSRRAAPAGWLRGRMNFRGFPNYDWLRISEQVSQVLQWQTYSATPTNPPVPFPDDPTQSGYGYPNCSFVKPTLTATPIRSTGVAGSYWYGDAILMKQLGGAPSQYVSWLPGDPANGTPATWSFNKPNGVSTDIVQRFCSCASINTCQK
jgi:hypothetical protein